MTQHPTCKDYLQVRFPLHSLPDSPLSGMRCREEKFSLEIQKVGLPDVCRWTPECLHCHPNFTGETSAIAEGDQQTEWFAEKQVEGLDKKIREMQIKLAIHRG